MLKNYRNLILILVVSIFSCAENPDQLELKMPEGLYVIDEKNKVLKNYAFENGQISTICELGEAANDIEIFEDNAYVVVSLDNKLIKLNLVNSNKEFISFQEGSNPYDMFITENNIFVTLSVSNQFSVIDRKNFKLITNINLISPGYPMGIAVDRNKIYIATSDGWTAQYSNSRIEIYSISNFTLITNIQLSLKNPQSLEIENDKLYIACTGEYNGSGGVLSMNTSNFEITRLPIPATNATCVYKGSTNLYVIESTWGGSGGIYIFKPDGSSTNILTGENLKGIQENKNYLYVSEGYGGIKTFKINLSDLSISEELNIGGGDLAIYSK